MRYFIALFLTACSTVPVAPMGDTGLPLEDAGPNAPDVWIELADTGADAGVDAAVVVPDTDAGTDAGAILPDAGPSSMDRWEVNWGAWRWLTDDAGVAPGTGPGCTYGMGDSYPVNCITIELAAAYCASQGRRLPTRDEWLAEAARYPVGDEIVGAAGPQGTIRATTVCTTGLCDTRGNLSELTFDGHVMGGNYTSPTPTLEEQSIAAPDPRVGFRCRAL